MLHIVCIFSDTVKIADSTYQVKNHVPINKIKTLRNTKVVVALEHQWYTLSHVCMFFLLLDLYFQERAQSFLKGATIQYPGGGGAEFLS